MKKCFVLAFTFSLVAMLGGCTANMNSIHRADSLGSGDHAGKVIYTDAKQRALMAIMASDYDSTQQHWRFCLEPSPDVFSAFATSLAGNASFGSANDPVSKSAAASLSIALSENASTIERTQTIGMLREMMYRTCERYLSKAIGETEFIVQSARDQRAMVAILAIEQLTGIQKAKSTAVTTVVESLVGGPTEKTILALDAAKKDQDKKQQAAEEARKKADDDTTADSCAVAKAADTETTKKLLCSAADKADSMAKAAAEHYTALLRSVQAQGEVSASAQGELQTAALNASAANAQIAQTVASIVTEVGNFNEIRMTCVVVLRKLSDEIATGKRILQVRALAADNMNSENDLAARAEMQRIARFESACIELVEAQTTAAAKQAEVQTQKAEAEIIEQKQRQANLLARYRTQASIVWTLLADSTARERGDILTNLEAISSVTLGLRLKTKMIAATDLNSFSRLFTEIPGTADRQKISETAATIVGSR